MGGVVYTPLQEMNRSLITIPQNQKVQGESMRVKCINIYNQISEKYEEKSLSLTIGKEYLIIEMIIYPGDEVIYRLICDDLTTPALFDSKQFIIISNKIPSNWKINQRFADGCNAITLAPEPWLELGFWGDYFDSNPEAIAVYEKEKEIIYAEAAVE